MAIANQKKLDNYVNKLYRAQQPNLREKLEVNSSLLARIGFTYYDDSEERGKRLPATSSQGKTVIDRCKRKCAICNREYYKDPSDFQIHHINGNRSKTITSNLVLLCHSCHRKVHTRVKAKLKDYEIRWKNRN